MCVFCKLNLYFHPSTFSRTSFRADALERRALLLLWPQNYETEIHLATTAARPTYHTQHAKMSFDPNYFGRSHS